MLLSYIIPLGFAYRRQLFDLFKRHEYWQVMSPMSTSLESWIGNYIQFLT